VAGAHYLREQGILVPEILSTLIEDHPVSAPIIFVAGYAFSVAFILPTLPVNLAAGILFGGWWGGVMATLGSSLGATAAFLLARSALGQPLAQRFDNRLLNWIEQQIEGYPWRVIAFVRLNPAFPSGPVNFLFGLTPISFKTYVWASLVFLFPPSLAVSLLGAELGHTIISGETARLLNLGTVFLAAASILLVGYLAGKALLRKERPETP